MRTACSRSVAARYRLGTVVASPATPPDPPAHSIRAAHAARRMLAAQLTPVRFTPSLHHPKLRPRLHLRGRSMHIPALPRVAFLGPPGSYSHSCAVERFDDSVHYIEQPTIPDVFRAVSPEIPFAVLPQENSVYGTVVDTYDVLRSPEAGHSVFIRGELVLAIQHCLIVRRGVKLQDVQRVMSHEQALGQCSRFLSERMPNAVLMKVPSTSAAANAVACCGEGSGEPESAAICSAHCADMFDGLEVLETAIQNERSNTTRFYLLANSLDRPLPGGKKVVRHQRALVRIGNQMRHHREGELQSSTHLSCLVTSTLLTTFGCPAIRIDRRPSLNDTPFDDVYFVEVGDLTPPITSETGTKSCEEEWLQRVQDGVERINATGGEATILGLW